VRWWQLNKEEWWVKYYAQNTKLWRLLTTVNAVLAVYWIATASTHPIKSALLAVINTLGAVQSFKNIRESRTIYHNRAAFDAEVSELLARIQSAADRRLKSTKRVVN
jgi:hypothetical protein